jgi:hypothetical protein
MQSGKRLTLKDYFAKHTRTHKNHKNTSWIIIVNCQVQLFLDNMVLANQNAKLTGPDQGFLVSRRPRPHTKALGTRLSPGVNSRAELVPSPGLTPRTALRAVGSGTNKILKKDPGWNQQEDVHGKSRKDLLKEASKDTDVCYQRLKNFILKPEISLMRRAAEQFICL